MSTEPLVSIVIPTYNRRRSIERAIRSVLRQTYERVEAIVVDDGSTDNTREIVSEIDSPKVRYHAHGINRGVLAAINTGLDHGRGDWFGLLGSDDELAPHAVATLMGVLAEIGPDAGIGTLIGNCMSTLDGTLTGRGVGESRFLDYGEFLCGRVGGEFWGLFSRAALQDRRFDERLRGFESILWLELWKTSKTYYVHRPLRRYEQGAPDALTGFDSMIRDAARMVEGYQALLAAHGADMRRLCPARYGHFVRRLAFFQIALGRRSEAISSLRRGASLLTAEGMGLLVGAVALPKAATVGLARYAHRRRMLRRPRGYGTWDLTLPGGAV